KSNDSATAIKFSPLNPSSEFQSHNGSDCMCEGPKSKSRALSPLLASPLGTGTASSLLGS
ncbi:MAG: hypothetical protein LQ349_009415, partial [Xanthoria aureola]